ncbi:YegP family protein [Halovivax limisalsi]
MIADSGEGYDRKAGARKGIESAKRNASDAAVVVRE